MRWLIPLIVMLCTLPLWAQVGEPPETTPPSASARPGTPANRPAAPPLLRTPGELLYENGGSLLRASLATPPMAGAGNPALESTSFFAVPEPEPRVVRKHDLVTIIIREQSEFMSDGSTETSKDAALEAEIAQMVRLNLSNFALENAVTGATPRIDLSGGRSFAGEGSVERTDRFTTRLTAEVVDVKPNGNLVLAARKRITTEDDEQVFLLAGIARAQDITADNTILSTQLYDLDVRRLSSGTVRNATRKGMLPKLLDQLDLW
jgi:flagellar L-ring protein precursor FlgH